MFYSTLISTNPLACFLENMPRMYHREILTAVKGVQLLDGIICEQSLTINIYKINVNKKQPKMIDLKEWWKTPWV